MKKLVVVSLAVLVSLFASCSSDDDSSGGGSIVGTWQVVSFTVNGEDDTVGECENMNTLTFTSETVTDVSFDQDSDGNCIADDPSTIAYSVSGNELVSEFGSSTFEVNGDTLIITNIDEGGEGFEKD